MKTVLIAVDLTEASQHAARVARHLFGSEATYLAINVGFDPMSPSGVAGMPVWGSVYGYPGPIQLRDPDDPSPADHARERAAHVAAEAGVDEAIPIGSVGDAAHAILRVAAEHDVDVIVVGSHERGWLRSLVEHSVADEVVDAGTIPVLVVPQPNDAN